jgi:hypothetical protein
MPHKIAIGDGWYYTEVDYNALAAETTAYVDKLVAERRALEAKLAAVWNVLAKNTELFNKACAAVDALNAAPQSETKGEAGDV